MKGFQLWGDNRKSLVQGISQRLVLAVLFGSVAMSIIIGFVTFEVGQKQYSRRIEKDLEFLSQSLTEPMWNLDTEMAARISRAFCQNEVAGFDLTDTQGNAIFSFHSGGSGFRLVRIREILYNGEILGKVEVSFSLSPLIKALWQQTAIALAVIAVVLLIQIMLTRKYVTSGLRQPLEWLRKMTSSDIVNGVLPDTESVPVEEFVPLARALGMMAGSISEKVRTIRISERRLQDQGNLLRLVINSIPQAVFWKNSESRYLGCNEVFSRRCGLGTPDEIIGKNDFDLPWEREEAVAFREADHEVMTTGKAKMHVVETLTSGTVAMVDTSKVPLIDENGNIFGVLGVFDDITERIKMERDLKISEDKFIKAFQSSLDIVAITTIPGGVIVEANDRLYDILGFSREEVIGKSTIDLNLWVDLTQRQEALAQLLAQKPVRNLDVRMRSKSGRVIDLTYSAEIVELRDGPYILAILRDMTERKNAEAEQERLRERLRQAEKLESLGTLAAGIAHDFNNLLSPIINYAEMTKSELQEGNEAIQWQDNIIKAGNRAAGLVRQILTFSRQNKPELKNIDVGKVVAEVLLLLKETLPSNIILRQVIETHAVIRADSTQIHQVVVNLCTNACHAMSYSGGELTVSLRDAVRDQIRPDDVGETSDEYVVLSVSDTGTGIDQETLGRIFEPYFTTKEEGKGTGLGLSVVHGIVKDHKGRITVESEIGHGTRFSIFLPVVLGQTAREPAGIGNGSAFISPSGSFRQMKVLLAEDDVLNRQLGRTMLENKGYKVVAVENGRLAIEKYSSEGPFDLILLDIQMPECNGDTAVAEIRRIEQGKKTGEHIPVIALSAKAFQGGGEELIKAGFDEVMAKPISIEELYRVLGKYSV